MVVIDLFAGAGGLSEGFVKAGFDVVAHVEKERWACETLKTRICYHYLERHNDLPLYYEYLRNSKGYSNIEENRKIIYDKYPKLRKKLEVEVINKAFGDPQFEKGASSIEEIINSVKEALIYNRKNPNTVDVIIGGPPCQAYSLIGRSRMGESVKNDKRNYLFKYYKKMVECFQPKVFIFENVPGIITAQGGKILKAIQDEFNEISYTLVSGPHMDDDSLNIVDASDYGVYQRRKRMILFGFRTEEGLAYPSFKARKTKEEPNTANAIKDLPPLQPGEGSDDFYVSYTDYVFSGKLSEYQCKMRKSCEGVVNHFARPHLERDRRNYKLAIKKCQEEGKQLKYREIPKRDRTHRNENDFEDRYKVHWWTSIPHTIVAHISKDGHYNIHPDGGQLRSLTVREAARIQSFPDNYKFEGPRTWQYVQVGNAVPPILAEVIAKAIKRDCFVSPRYADYTNK